MSTRSVLRKKLQPRSRPNTTKLAANKLNVSAACLCKVSVGKQSSRPYLTQALHQTARKARLETNKV